ncbi:hypothetical protein FQN54_004080 [Arachnomyces sp. PD_36]|nr:hypothetical protein FQN54_004080 [Arachnomyces sp. PD_36]
MDAKQALFHVRQFSKKIRREKPDEPLAKGLAQHVDWETQQEHQGKRLYADSVEQSLRKYHDEQLDSEIVSDSSNAISELVKVADKLEVSWKDVIKDLNTNKRTKDLNINELENPSVDKLLELVKKAEGEIEAKLRDTKRGRVKSWFFTFSRRINNHKFLLDMLPVGDKYTSVLTGGFTACIKAAMAHHDIAEKISDCLEKLSDQTYKLRKAMMDKIMNDYIQHHIAQFYCSLFDLLVKILKDWFGSWTKRISHSFGTSFEEFVQKSMDSLEYHTKEVKDELNSVITDQVVTKLDKVSQQLGAFVQAGFLGHIVDAPMQSMKGSMTPGALQSAMQAQGSFIAFGPHTGVENSQHIQYGHTNWSSVHPRALAAANHGVESPHRTLQTIQEAASWLKRYMQSDKVDKLVEQTRYLSTSSIVYHRLLQWTSCKSSEALWIEGPPTMSEPSQNTLTSAFILANFKSLEIPVISYFCAYDPSQWQSFSLPEELLKMVYALIYQVSAILPVSLESDPDEPLPLFYTRIGRLTPQLQSLPEAIALLGDMLSAGPPLFACIVDGLLLLDKEQESPFFRECLNDFVDVLRNGTQSPVSGPQTVKVWLSTDGHSWLLQDAVRAGWLEVQKIGSDSQDEPLRLRMMDVSGAN